MGDFHIKKIILPSGKAVEIVYFHQEPGAEVEATTTTTTSAVPAWRRPAAWSAGMARCRSQASSG